MVKHLREAVLAVFADQPGSVINIAYITTAICQAWEVESVDLETTTNYLRKSILLDCVKANGFLAFAPRGGILLRPQPSTNGGSS
jgi:hypothetical protein